MGRCLSYSSTNPQRNLPEMQMKLAHTLAGLAVAIGFSAANAKEADNHRYPSYSASSTSRAAVASDTIAALRAGQIQYGEASRFVDPVGVGVPRAQVVAETREAMRLGLLNPTEAVPKFATPAQLEQIRLAGLKARDDVAMARSR